MRQFKILLAVLLLVILAGCAGNMGISEETRLKRELKKFENFSGSGIVELSAFGFSLRKPFVLSKSLEQMRMDVVEGGALGAGGSPLISVYMGQYISLKSTLMPALEALDLAGKLPKGPEALFATADYVVDRYGKEIIENKALIRDSLQITFRSNYQLESIRDGKTGIRVETNYNRQGNPDDISIFTNKGISARFIFDEMDYSRPEIVALPKPEPKSESFMDLFQQGGMMQLLKGFLDN
jgi:hypothetical protein